VLDSTRLIWPGHDPRGEAACEAVAPYLFERGVTQRWLARARSAPYGLIPAFNLDHALIYIDLPQNLGGIGFAGACNDRWYARGWPRIRVDLCRLTEQKDTWALQVQQKLSELRDQRP